MMSLRSVMIVCSIYVNTDIVVISRSVEKLSLRGKYMYHMMPVIKGRQAIVICV